MVVKVTWAPADPQLIAKILLSEGCDSRVGMDSKGWVIHKGCECVFEIYLLSLEQRLRTASDICSIHSILDINSKSRGRRIFQSTIQEGSLTIGDDINLTLSGGHSTFEFAHLFRREWQVNS